jgi:hypothetical protein
LAQQDSAVRETLVLQPIVTVFFRGLKDIQEGDEIDLGTAGQWAAYLVDSIKIVTPDDVSVLRTGTSIIDPGDMLPLLFRRKCTESLNCPGFSQYPK